jgi:HK97 family phage portal protein
MGLFDSFFNRKTTLTQQNRELIYRMFGSFLPKNLQQTDRAYLEEGYEANVDVYAVIKKITETYKAVPVIVEQRTSEGWEQIEDSTLHELMNNPNPGKGYTWEDIEEMMMIYLLSNGNSYLIGQEGLFNTQIQEVDVLPSPSIEIKSNSDFFMPEIKYQFQLGNQNRLFESEQIEHIRFFNPSYLCVEDSFKGLSPIQVAARVVQSGNDKWDATANLLQNRGAIGLITDKSNRPMTPDEAARVQSAFQADTAGTNNFGKVKVTNKDLDFISMAMSSTDLQIIEQGVVNLRAICSVYGVDSSLINDPANQTYNNRKEAVKSMYTNTIMPLAEKIYTKHNSFISKNHYPDGSVRMRKDFSDIEALQTDKKQEAEKDKIVMDGVKSIMEMPISQEAKELLLVETYDYSAEEAAIISNPPIEVGNVDADFEDIPEAANANAEAQANLRGSVGGVQGILAVQQGVASGVTSPSAAVTTLVEIYGFDDATARRVLGL